MSALSDELRRAIDELTAAARAQVESLGEKYKARAEEYRAIVQRAGEDVLAGSLDLDGAKRVLGRVTTSLRTDLVLAGFDAQAAAVETATSAAMIALKLVLAALA